MATDRYHMRAYEARRRRTLATDPSLKADLELIAQEWVALAERWNGLNEDGRNSKIDMTTGYNQRQCWVWRNGAKGHHQDLERRPSQCRDCFCS
jgi:hypothetical protein